MATNHAVTAGDSLIPRAFQRTLLWCLLVVTVIVSASTSTLSHAQHANLSREQLAILLMLLKTSSFEDESSTSDPEAALLQQYRKNIAQQVVGAACVNCHVSGGVAGSTRLILSPGDDEANLAAIRAFNELVGDDGAPAVGSELDRAIGHVNRHPTERREVAPLAPAKRGEFFLRLLQVFEAVNGSPVGLALVRC